jgi:uncharacterized protein with PIN domain
MINIRFRHLTQEEKTKTSLVIRSGCNIGCRTLSREMTAIMRFGHAAHIIAILKLGDMVSYCREEGADAGN